MCSNRAATRVNILKTWEKHHSWNTLICRYFANSRNPQQTIVLPSHGRGRWFEPSIAHLEKVAFCRRNVSRNEKLGASPSFLYTSSTPTQFSRSCLVKEPLN